MKLHRATAQAMSEDAATLALLHDRELTPKVLADLKAIGFPGNFGMLPRGEKEQAVFEMMRDTVAVLPDEPDVVYMDNLAADYASIYLTGALDLSPFESFWISDEHLLCQEAMFDMRSLYAADGLAVPDWRQRPDDHLVYQLEFLSKRLAMLADGIAAHDIVNAYSRWRGVAVLLDYHLLRWLPDFSIRVTQRCDTEFYGALALLTDAWCEQLRDMIAVHLGEPRPSKDEVEAILRPRAPREVPPTPIHFMPGIGGPSW
jgi:TorA maturation chaperone TorD